MDALWYQYQREHAGESPPCRRLSRVAMRYQWLAAPRLALAYARGEAGWRQGQMALTREVYWYAPVLDLLVPDHRAHQTEPSGWWIVSWRVTQRALAIYRAAVHTSCRAGGGSAIGEEVVDCLDRWIESGAWRGVAAAISPRHPGPGGRPRGRKRRGRRPARQSLGLP